MGIGDGKSVKIRPMRYISIQNTFWVDSNKAVCCNDNNNRYLRLRRRVKQLAIQKENRIHSKTEYVVSYMTKWKITLGKGTESCTTPGTSYLNRQRQQCPERDSGRWTLEWKRQGKRLRGGSRKKYIDGVVADLRSGRNVKDEWGEKG